MAQLKAISLAVTTALALAACGGGGGSGSSSTASGNGGTVATQSVAVTPSLGQIATGTPAKLKNKAGLTVAETTVGTDGKIKFDFDPNKLTDKVFVVEVGGGAPFKYYDEATGKEETFTGTLNSVGAYTGQKDFAVTPLTHLAYKRVEASLASLKAEDAQASNKLVAKMFLGDADFDLHTPPALVSSVNKDLGSATGNAAKYASVLALFAAASEKEGVPLEQALKATAQVFVASAGNAINLTTANVAGVLLPSELIQAASQLDGSLKDQAEKATAAVNVDDVIDSDELSIIKDKVQQESSGGLSDIQQAKLMLNDLRSNLTEVDRALQVQLQDRLASTLLPDGIEITQYSHRAVSALAAGVNMAYQRPGYEGTQYTTPTTTYKYVRTSDGGICLDRPIESFIPSNITGHIYLPMTAVYCTDGSAFDWKTWSTVTRYLAIAKAGNSGFSWKVVTVSTPYLGNGQQGTPVVSTPATGNGTITYGDQYATAARIEGDLGRLNSYLPNAKTVLSYQIGSDQKSLTFAGSISTNYQFDTNNTTDPRLLALNGKAINLAISEASLKLDSVPALDNSETFAPTEVKLKASLDLAGVKFSGDLLIDERKADKQKGYDLSHARFIGDFVVDGNKVFSGTLEGRVDQSQYDPGVVTSAENYEKRSVSFDGLLYNATRPLKLSLTAQDTGYLSQAFTLGYSYTSAAGKTLLIAGSGTRDTNGAVGLTLTSPAGIRFELAQALGDARIGVIRNSSGTVIGTIYKSKVVFSDGSSVSLL
ncbi:hypothetical protein [Crenobacter caeni]|uniref:Autotransporter domain-containing protein n=1 Tax=Crenobacter caeni TaxID=2705474 RepID=A0A6B2KSX3_9NEIS|nr:hypothetical protein [Crenobacter caeni]NDV13346.1 hypothetical protein [Crenobacter caeni]